MRLLLEGAPADMLARLRSLAPRAVQAGLELVIPGPTATRAAVLDCVRDAGATLRALTVEEGRLDLLYRELVGRSDAQEGA
jgi:Cu-processing system ATP-binding protein